MSLTKINPDVIDVAATGIAIKNDNTAGGVGAAIATLAPLASPALTGTPTIGGVAAATTASTVANSTKWAGANKTVSTAGPSGGADGDIWIVRAV